MLSGTAIAFYVASVLGIMAYHAWFFIRTSAEADEPRRPADDDEAPD